LADLAVVIVSWNVCELLRACLGSLQQDLDRSSIQADVYVVDNASVDGTPEMVSVDFPQVRLTACRENLGFAAGNNMGLRQILEEDAGACRFVWLLNPDTEVLAGAARALVACLEGRQDAGVAGAKLLNSDGSLQHSAFRYPGLIQLAVELFNVPDRVYDTRLNGRYAPTLYGQAEPFRVDHPLGAAMMVRREAVTQVGLLDEDYHMYCEEIDWCWRMRRAGWRAYCAPDAVITHHAGQSSAQVPATSFVNLWKSRARLYSRICGRLRFRTAARMVRLGMERRGRTGSHEMREACMDVVRFWQSLA
jgi:GT2 family glycosyltransferase